MTQKEELDYKITIGADYSGAKVLRELPLKQATKTHYSRQFECLCKCGKTFAISLLSLIKPKQHICIDCRNDKMRKPPTALQCQYPRLWDIYNGMLYRCNRAKPNTSSWKSYRGKGISVCKEWENDFVAFVNWSLQNGYQSTLSIDRIDANGNYEPNNCRWATAKKQSNNQKARRSLFNVVIGGEIINLKTAAEKYNVPYSRLRSRYQRGIRGDNLLRNDLRIHKGRSYGFY